MTNATSSDWPRGEQLDTVPLLKADDVAVLLGVPRSSVYEYARRTGDPLPAVRIGRHLRFRRDELVAWVSAQRNFVVGAERTQAAAAPSRRPASSGQGDGWWRSA
jgi:excisionase family DNA binding protein